MPRTYRRAEKEAFVTALAERLSYTVAAETVGISPRTALRWRTEDPAYQARCDEARLEAAGRLEASAFEVALNADGKHPPRDSTLMKIFMMKRFDAGYRENYRAESAFPANFTFTLDLSVGAPEGVAERVRARLIESAPIEVFKQLEDGHDT